MNHRLVALRQNSSPTQVSLALLAHANCQVASASTTVLHLAVGCDPKTLFGRFVRLHLGHKYSLFQKYLTNFVILDSKLPKQPIARTQKCNNESFSRQGKIVQTGRLLEQFVLSVEDEGG